jgi:A/G-specific adenine glycosylase
MPPTSAENDLPPLHPATKDRFKRTASGGTCSKKTVERFRKIIYDYYESCGRRLPWKETTNPYAILVSEVMLQQTQTQRVTEKYLPFLTRFPNFSSLSRASLQTVLEEWLGLGYNRRAMALKKIAEEVAHRFAGILPDSIEELQTLPGIGKYTAAAIAVFAFNQPVLLLETNIRTVFIHFFFHCRQDIEDREIIPLVERTLDASNPRRWYNALMDYGAMLKRTHPNPGRKSLHYQKQSPFAGSDRRIRGMILRTLTEEGPQTASTLIRRVNEDAERVRKILDALVKEGLIRKVGRRFSIA